MFKSKALPSLENNLKTGNSLIDFDYEGEDEEKTKPFSWKEAFPEVFEQDRFAIVIGNPPYSYQISSQQQQYFNIYSGYETVFYYDAWVKRYVISYI